MEIDLALLADAATIDASGKLNILGVFDRISVARFPASHPHVSLVFRFSATMAESGKHRVEIVLKDPDGKELLHLNGDLQVAPGGGPAGGQIRVPQVLNIDRLVFAKAGRYTFEVIVDGEHQASLPLTVHGGTSHGGTPPMPGTGRPPAQA